MKEFILATKYKKRVNIILKYFANAGICNQSDLADAPTTIGHFAGIDIYDLVAELQLAIAKGVSEKPKKSSRVLPTSTPIVNTEIEKNEEKTWLQAE